MTPKILNINFLILIQFFLSSCFMVDAQNLVIQKNLSDTTYKKLLRQSELNVLLNDVKSNPYLQLERLAAYFFHQRINEYRLKNKLTTLYWDDRMWLAARNHNLYLWKLGALTHEQTKSGAFYSGTQPWDRMQFVMYNAFKMQIYAENVLYNFTYCNNRYVYENALHIADESFEQWRKSPPHNKNMLHPEFFAHGTAFLVVEGRNQVYGTTNFGNASDFIMNEISIDWDSELQKQYPPTFKINATIATEYKWLPNDEIIKVLSVVKENMPLMTRLADKKMSLIAAKHLSYMLANKSISTKEDKRKPKYYASTTFKRYLKATGKNNFFYALSHKFSEKYMVLICTQNELITGTYLTRIANNLKDILPETKFIGHWGCAVELTNTNDENYVCHLNLVYVNSDSKR